MQKGTTKIANFFDRQEPIVKRQLRNSVEKQKSRTLQMNLKTKVMKSLKANRIEKEILSNKEMNQAKGGNTCGCGCHYEGKGGSTKMDNANANYENNLWSPDSIVRIDGHTSWGVW